MDTKEALHKFRFIDFVFSEESWRKILRKAYGFDKLPDDETLGWCLYFIKKEMPDIEIYIDRLARAVAYEIKEQGKELTEDVFMRAMIDVLNEVTIHELCHKIGGILNEELIERMTKSMLAEACMTWHYIPCPKLQKMVTWLECLKCKDSEKHPSCPLQRIREDAFKYKYEPNKYHVSELIFPRYAYYNRKYKYAMSWNEYWDLFYGKALGAYIESLYARDRSEMEVAVQLGDYTVYGHADLVDDKELKLYEIKYYYALRHVYKSKKAKPEHVLQAQAYYSLGLRSRPDIFKNITGIKVLYFSKTRERNVPRYVEMDVEMKDIMDWIEKQAKILHEAIKNDTPPKCRCPEWKCKYCPFPTCKYHPNHGEKNE